MDIHSSREARCAIRAAAATVYLTGEAVYIYTYNTYTLPARCAMRIRYVSYREGWLTTDICVHPGQPTP